MRGAKRFYLEAKTLYGEGDYPAAARRLAQALKLDPAAVLYFNLGQALRLAGDARGAINAYTTFLKMDPHATNAATARERMVELAQAMAGSAVPDTTPPRITAQLPASVPAGQLFELAATMQDPSGIFQPKLMYRRAGQSSYIGVGMSGGQERFVAALPAMEPGTLELYFEAYDGKGNGPSRDGTPTYPLRVTVLATPVPRGLDEPPVHPNFVAPGNGSAPALHPRSAAAEPGFVLPPVSNPDHLIGTAPVPPGAAHPRRGPSTALGVSGTSTWRLPAWVSSGVTVAALGVGAYFISAAAGGASRASSAETQSAVDAARADAQHDTLGANISFGTAAVAAVTAGVMWWLEYRTPSADAQRTIP